MAEQVSSTRTLLIGNTTGINVTNGVARIMSIEATNSSTPAASAFVQFFDAAAADVVLGTTVPTATVHVPAAAATVNGTVSLDFGAGWLLSNRLSIFGTTTAEGATPASGILLQAWVS